MNRGIVIVIAATAAASCAGTGDIAVRALPTPLATGQRTVSFRVAEANGQFALGNVALALESYRKALRDDPASVDAMVGMAASYDAMGRFDVSRRHYEAALAIEPANRDLLGRLAASLLQQGRAAESAAIRLEIASRERTVAVVPSKPAPIPVASAPPPAMRTAVVAIRPTAPIPAPVAAPVPPPEPAFVEEAVAQVGASVTLALPVARQVTAVTVSLLPAREPAAPSPPVKVARAPVAPPVPVKIAEPVRITGPRLERLSLGEVALVTTHNSTNAFAPRPFVSSLAPSRPQVAALSRPTKQLASLARPSPILLLNAARSQGLAAHTRRYLIARGFTGAQIGDAPRVRATTLIIAPAADRLRARRIARALGILTRPVEGKRLTLVLGRDAAARRVLGS